MQILNHFADLITFVHLNFYHCDCDETNVSEYRKLLELARGNSVKSIEIGHNPCNLNIIDILAWNSTFENVENVKIHQNFMEINSSVQICQRIIEFVSDIHHTISNCQLRHMFPNVRKLDLNCITLNDPNSLDCEFKYLEELIVDGGLVDNGPFMGDYSRTFDKLLIKNPMIKRIHRE